MAASYSLALVGFAQHESATFESFFRLAARRPPAYFVQDEVMDAEVLVVNADNLQAVHLVRYAELPGKVLLVGSTDAGTGWPLQRKPVKLVSVLAALDGLVGEAAASTAAARAPWSHSPASHPPPVAARYGADRGFAATQPYDEHNPPLPRPAAARRRQGADTEFPPTQTMERDNASAVAPRLARVSTPPPSAARTRELMRPGVMGVTDFGGLDELPLPPSGPQTPTTRSPRTRSNPDRAAGAEPARGEMLLVAESLVEGRILHKRFKRYGLTIDWSRESRQAQAMLKAHAYRLVVIDRLTGEPDAYQVCRNAKQGRLPNGQSPVVVMFAATSGSMDRIKASLAGCDAYLTRSVGDGELYKVLEKHRLVNLDGFEATNVGF